MIDAHQLLALRKRAEKFQIGSSVQQIADLRFLISAVDELMAAKQKCQFLIKQIEDSTMEQAVEFGAYRRASLISRHVCTRTAFNAAREATA